MIDFELGWRAVPGMFSTGDGYALQRAVRMAPAGTGVVELGAWCGRSLACICDVVPHSVSVFSYDNYLVDSQADGEGASPITPPVACALRKTVQEHYSKQGVDVTVHVEEAAEAGAKYIGPPVSALLVDDHHSAEQIAGNLKAWLPKCHDKCIMLFHDYGHVPYGIIPVCEGVMPAAGFKFVGQPVTSGLGIWSRGFELGQGVGTGR